MATFTKVLLSGSIGGQPVKVTNTSSTGTLIHTTGTSSSVIDEIWLYCNNTSGVSVNLTIEYGGTASPDNQILVAIPSGSGLSILVPGLILTGDGSTGRSVRAFAGTINVINIVGYVNRIS